MQFRDTDSGALKHGNCGYLRIFPLHSLSVLLNNSDTLFRYGWPTIVAQQAFYPSFIVFLTGLPRYGGITRNYVAASHHAIATLDKT